MTHVMKQAGLLGFGCALFSISLVACKDDKRHSEDPTIEPEEHEAHWAYSGDTGPEFWGNLSEDYALCGEGEFQSPVNFPIALVPTELSHLEFDYAPTPGILVDNGHTILVELEQESELLVDSKAHALLQFHFHAKSEHQVDGEHYPLEVHFVHRSSDGELAVVGYFFEEGKANVALASVFAAMADSSEAPLDLEMDLDLQALQPEDRTGWTYSGSLTTPPCSEGVKWNVHAKPLTASKAQLDAFSNIHDGSYRPVLTNEHIDELLDALPQD